MVAQCVKLPPVIMASHTGVLDWSISLIIHLGKKCMVTAVSETLPLTKETQLKFSGSGPNLACCSKSRKLPSGWEVSVSLSSTLPFQ